MPLTAERLMDILDNQNSFFQLFIVKALERILNELNPAALDEILDAMLPATVNSQLVMFGHKLGDYMGLDRATIKNKFTKSDDSPLLDADVDAIFAAAGITTGTSLPGPVGGPVKEESVDGGIPKETAKKNEPVDKKVTTVKKGSDEPKK